MSNELFPGLFSYGLGDHFDNNESEIETTDGLAAPGYDEKSHSLEQGFYGYQSFQCDNIDCLLNDNKLDDIP